MTKYKPGSSDRSAYTKSAKSNITVGENSDLAKKKKRKVKKKRWPKVVIVVALMLIAIAMVIYAVFLYFTGGLKQTRLDNEDLGIVEIPTRVDEEGNVIENHIVNIAMFGVDTRDTSASFGDQGRSDSIMIASIDPEKNTIKLTSILRDSKVPIEGHDPQKINAAYKYGGAQLAIKTLNQNFKLDISDYVTVDFGELETVIDILGGVDIELTEDEAYYVNDYSANVMYYYGYDAVAGWNTLNGAQAVSYSRIRKIDSDYYRAGRQQTVLTALFNKLKGTPKSQYPTLIKQLLDCVETSLSYTDILGMATSFDLSSAELIKNTIPDEQYEEGLWGGIDDTGSWVWVYDLDAAADRLHEIIYGE